MPQRSCSSRDQRRALDLSAHVVTDRGAGYFDVAARRAFLESTDNPILRKQIAELGHDVSCEEKLALPVLDYELRLPLLYEETEAWRAAIEPLFAFEDAVSDLAGGFVATGNPGFAGCLLDLLGQWAAADALMEFAYTPEDLQAWFDIEDMLFAAGLAYAVVPDQIPGRAADQRRIEDWLVAAAHNHLEIPGGPDSCCNNHLYRRALYATIIGVDPAGRSPAHDEVAMPAGAAPGSRSRRSAVRSRRSSRAPPDDAAATPRS